MMKAKQVNMKYLFQLYSFHLNLNHREIWLPKWRLNKFSCQGEHLIRIVLTGFTDIFSYDIYLYFQRSFCESEIKVSLTNFFSLANKKVLYTHVHRYKFS